MSYVSAKCPACSRILQVDPEEEAGICEYCGKPYITEKAIALYQDAVPVGRSDEADREFALAHLLDGIRDNPKYYEKNFNKKKFAESFDDYQRWRSETYAAMDRYIVANPTRRAELLEEFVEAFLLDWERYHKTEHRGQRAAFADKLTLALYEVPAIQSMDLNVGLDYVTLLQKRFSAKYPDNRFEIATYKVLAAGFERKKLCFITTAVCEFEGKPDDCAELTAFRAFRDGWMKENGGEDLIEEYYRLAPGLVHMLDYGGDREKQYAALRSDYLTPCYEALRCGDMQTCKTRYIQMVLHLKAAYGLQ